MVDVLKFEWNTLRCASKGLACLGEWFLIAVVTMVVVAVSQVAMANEELLAEAQEELQVGDYDDAAKWFLKLIDQADLEESSKIAAYIGMSRVYSEQGKYAEAEGVLEKGLEKFVAH